MSLIRDHNLPMLNARSDWIDWYNSIEDLAKRNEVWKYCDPLGIENLVFTSTKPSDSASKDTIQKFQSLQSIFDSEKKKYDKVSDRIDYTVCQEFKQHYLGKHDVRSKLIALSDSIQPNAKDQRQDIRTEFEKLRKGPGNTSLDKWLGRWPALVNSAKRYTIENLSEPQICEAFVEACRDINPPFYNYMKSKDAQTESQASVINQTETALRRISDALISALNAISPEHASHGPIAVGDSSDADSDDAVDEVDAPAVQRARNTIDRTLRSFRRLKPTLSDNRITISFCIKQYRSMAPPSEKIARGRAAHATLQGRKHGRDPKTSDEEDGQPRRKREAIGSSSVSATQPSCLRDCVCGQAHKYADCWYLNPAKAPTRWRPQVHIQSKVITAITGSHRQRGKIERSFSRSKIALPDFWPSSNADEQSEKAASQASSVTVTSTRQTRPRASFAITRHALSITRSHGHDSYFRLDNCADTHVCNDRSRFTYYKRVQDEIIRFGDTDTRVEGIGNVSVDVTTPAGHGLVQLENVAYVPGFHWNLLSTHALEKQGLFFNTRTCWMEFSNGTRAFQVTKRGAFRVVEPNTTRAPPNSNKAQKTANASSTRKTSQNPKNAIASIDIWHARLGHIRKEALLHVPNTTKGVTLSTRNFERNAELCETCELAQAHQHISRIPTWRGTYPFEKVHMDLIDMEQAFNADSWVVHFYCDYSSYHISFNLPNKTQDELVSVTKEFLAITNTNWGFTTRYIRSDGEKGLGNEWKEMIAAKGITFTPSPPDTPDQNGLAERSGGVIMTTARKLRIQSRLPHRLWPHIVSHATRLLNRIPVQRKDWRTPFEMVHGRQPDLSHLKIIGSRAYVLIKSRRDRPARAKLQEKALMGWLVGTEATNIHKVWIPHSNRVITSRDVRIDENVVYDPQYSKDPPQREQAMSTTLNDADLDESDNDMLLIGSDTAEPRRTQAGKQGHEAPPAGSGGDGTSLREIPPQVMLRGAPTRWPYPTPVSLGSGPHQRSTTQEVLGHRTGATNDASVLQNLRTSTGRKIRLSRRGQDAVGATQTHATQRYNEKKARRQAYALRLERAKLGQQVAHAFAAAQSMRIHRKDLLPPPDFWHQLKRHPEAKGFRRAADAELASLEEKKTFELVDYPEDKQVLPLKWVFTYKVDDAGYLVRHKARICVRGDLQHHVSDDIYAATGAYRSFRILMALVCAFGLLCHQIDFKNAFTNADMDEEVYTACPPGYCTPGKVWKLRKALYGLRKSPKLWFNELVSFLKGLGFDHCPDEPCILINNQTGLILFLYVDDMLVIAQPECIHLIQDFKLRLNSRYGIKDLSEAISFLNISILRNTRDKKLWISQHGYIEKICTKFGIDDTGRTATTPLLSSYRPQQYEGQATLHQITEMQEKVGSILYAAVVSRPDVSFAASQLSQFTLNPSPEHLRYANRVLAYLLATKYYAIEFLGSVETTTEVETRDEEVLQLSSDASFADDPETRRSTQGYLMKLFNGPIMWQSSKQKTVTTSTTEAELLSLSHTAKETIGLYRLFKQIQFDPEHQPRILCDNQQTTGLIQKDRPQASSKLKHVDIHSLWLRQVYKDGTVTVQWVPTTEMPSDGFTKPLSAEKHSQFVRHLGLVDISSRIDPAHRHEEANSDDNQTSSETD